MNAKFSFHLESRDRRRDLPPKIIIGRQEQESEAQVALRALAYVLFFRERLQIGGNLHRHDIPFVPDLAQLDYELRPRLWIQCGGCGAGKLHKLAIKMPDAEIWIVLPSAAAADELEQAMAREELRRGRYQLLALDADMFAEFCGRLKPRNQLLWVAGGFEPPGMEFDFNGLWFDAGFGHRRV